MSIGLIPKNHEYLKMMHKYLDCVAQNLLTISESRRRTTSDEDLKMIKKPVEEGEEPSGESITTFEKPGSIKPIEHAMGEDEEHGDLESLVSYFT